MPLKTSTSLRYAMPVGNQYCTVTFFVQIRVLS